MKTVSKNLACPTLYLLLADMSPLSTDDTQMVNSCEVHFSAAWCAYFLFLELSKARAFEASVRRGGSNEGGDLLHRRSRQKNFAHVQRAAMREIFDVKVLFPKLVCSASKFQTSCLWNLTRASLAKATNSRALRIASAELRMHASANLMNKKVCCRCLLFVGS